MNEFLKNTWPIIKEYYWIAFIPVAIFAFFSSQAEKEDIDKNKSIAYGLVTRSVPLAKKFSKRSYHYTFNVDGKKYSGSSIGWISDNIDDGNYYPVEFSTKNPKHNRMDFEIEYSYVVNINNSGKIDTTYIPKSEMKIKISEEDSERIEKLRQNTETKN
ncbi:hypothetical protein [uncultured Maribacter sp.]|uniref:hypothetical protein n=1 Tax=uncultured Maribacter sp. TaxID=431308 RepID=UPI002602901E|nr:hypothetical protein [uncultured Maribacter sp.]